jgi:hypothetical protein
MSDVLKGCLNNYDADELFETFGMDEKQTKICMTCPNSVMEGGIISCKYIVDKVDEESMN